MVDDQAPVTSFSNRDFRNVMGCFATGVTVVTTCGAAGELVGMTANSFSAVSLQPPLVLFCIDRGANCFAVFEAADSFAVNILTAEQTNISAIFSSNDDDRFAKVGSHIGRTGAPILEQALATIECTVHARYDGGDHEIVLGHVRQMHMRQDQQPLLYYAGSYGTLAAT